ncbi:MAG: hypothetical protein KDC83_09105 [Flavobacteriales bacterium]|nr:hypothetical protein [Flavobacteriales bacterium]
MIKPRIERDAMAYYRGQVGYILSQFGGRKGSCHEMTNELNGCMFICTSLLNNYELE